jgi:general secretion pathway protein B
VEEAELAQRAEREDSAAKAAKRAEPAKGEAKRSRSPRGGEAAKAATSPAKKAEARASPKASAKAPAASPPIAAEPPSRVPRLNELPEELRRQVPALAVGGWVYSPQVEKRMVIVNGQVFQEGALLAPELKLEQVRPKSAVFSIRGQRFEISL